MSLLTKLVPSSGGTASRRLLGIEGLRAVAAGAVVVYHVWLIGGRVGQGTRAEVFFMNLALGVTLFFALSGFLLYRPFAAAIARGIPRPSIGNYLRNRALRILPAYWVILVLTTLVLQSTWTRTGDGSLALGTLEPLELVKSMLLIHNYFPNSVVIGVGPAWSLAVEIVFYLLLPLLVLIVARLALNQPERTRRVLILMIPPLMLLALGLAGKYVAGILVPGTPAEGYGDNWHSVIERSFLAQADLFSFGMAAAVLHTEVVDGRLRLPRWWRVFAGLAGLVLFVACARSLGSGQLSYLPQNTGVALAAALLLAIVTFPSGTGRAPAPQRVLEWPLIVSAGLISYSVFLWNEPVLHWLAGHGITASTWPEFAGLLALATVIVVALSVITYRFVELPALRRKRKPRAIDAAQLEAAP